MTTTSIARQLAVAGCVHAAEEAALLVGAARTADELRTMIARRVAGEPLEHVVGWADFHGLRLAVDRGVFVPRAGSALLVREAGSLVRCLTGPAGTAVVVDLCCGSGAIGAALVAELPQVRLHAVDIDARAVACARRNLSPFGAAVHQGNLFRALPRRLRRRIDLVVASPPYVPTEEIRLLSSEAREFEPPVALDGGSRGLAVVEQIARGATQWLSPGGFLAVEVADRQVDRTELLLDRLGFATRAVTSEAHGSTVVTGHCEHRQSHARDPGPAEAAGAPRRRVLGSARRTAAERAPARR
ncbi:MAG: putative protein N(5)-glutamine methyltransferase [Kineosporiaceae bacterium]